MTNYAYRAIAPDGRPASGEVEASSQSGAVAQIRRLGVVPVEISEVTARAARLTVNAGARRAVTKTVSELAVLLQARLPLDRALALTLENIEHPGVRAAFLEVLKAVKEGQPLSRAMAGNPELFPAMVRAMAEAGEANGQLGAALERLALSLKQADDLAALIGTAMIYPLMLLFIAVSVILLMMLFVVPQFESLFAGAGDRLPAESRAVLAASVWLRSWGWHALAVGIGLAVVVRLWLRQPAVRAWRDGAVLRVPQLGTLVQYIETARFSRTLGALIDGGVALPTALAVAQRTIRNSVMAAAVGTVASGVKEGGGLTAPLAATGVFPRLAIGFLRTGEEISQLGLMLTRLSDVLDSDVKLRLQRIIGLLTPVITIVLGAAVAGIIAAIMTAILGFNDLAVV